MARTVRLIWLSAACSIARKGPTSLPVGDITPIAAAARRTGNRAAPARMTPAQRRTEAAAPLVDVNGRPLEAGVLPEGTSAAAQERMQRLFAGTWLGEGAPRPMGAFVVTFDARVRQQVEGGSTDVRTRFLFKEEGRGWIRGEFPRSGRASGPGPEGDWLLDGDEVVDLSDFSNAESRRVGLSILPIVNRRIQNHANTT